MLKNEKFTYDYTNLIHVHFVSKSTPKVEKSFAHVKYELLDHTRLTNITTHQYLTADYSRLQQTTADYSRLQQTTADYSRLQQTTADYSRLQQTTADYSRLHYLRY